MNNFSSCLYVDSIYHLCRLVKLGIGNSIKENNIVVKSMTPRLYRLAIIINDIAKKWYRLVEEEIHSRLTSLSIAINPWSHMDGWKSELLLRWQEMCSSSYYYYFTYYIVVFETSAQWAKTLKKLKLWYLLFTLWATLLEKNVK